MSVRQAHIFAFWSVERLACLYSMRVPAGACIAHRAARSRSAFPLMVIMARLISAPHNVRQASEIQNESCDGTWRIANSHREGVYNPDDVHAHALPFRKSRMGHA